MNACSAVYERKVRGSLEGIRGKLHHICEIKAISLYCIRKGAEHQWLSGTVFRRGRGVTLRLVVSRLVVSDATAFAWGTIVGVRGIELTFPVVHGLMVDAVSEHEVVFVGDDVACVDGGALVCVFAQELELGVAKSCGVKVRPKGLDVGHVVNVHLSHVYEQRCVDFVNGVDYVVRDVLGESPARACAAAVVASVV